MVATSPAPAPGHAGIRLRPVLGAQLLALIRYAVEEEFQRVGNATQLPDCSLLPGYSDTSDFDFNLEFCISSLFGIFRLKFDSQLVMF